jgi:asparaginyl-tRNA synthetase
MQSPHLAHLESDIQKITEVHLLDQEVWVTWVKLLSDIYRASYDGARKYFAESGSTEIFPTILGGALGACENFQTVYDLGEKLPERFLSQTAQIQLEVCLRLTPEVSCITRSFRREANIHDGRHLREFTLIEMEKSNCDLDQMLTTIEELVKAIVTMISQKKKTEIENFLEINFEEKTAPYISQPFARLTYTEAIEILQATGKDIAWGADLNHADEQALSKHMGGKPFFLTHFPLAIKFFNMKQNDENPEIVNSVDLILPHSGEALGGAEREVQYEKIWDRFQHSDAYHIMMERGLTEEDFGCYFNVTKTFETHPHAGFGLGLERLLQSLLITEQTDIRVFSLPFILTTWLVDREKI